MTAEQPDTNTAALEREARELLAAEYDRGAGDGQYPTYAALARGTSGAFTMCSIRAVQAALQQREELRAQLAALPRQQAVQAAGVEETIRYLRDLSANMLRNDADMRLDDCEDSAVVADRLELAAGQSAAPAPAGDREAIARSLFESFCRRSRRGLAGSSYAETPFDRLPKSFKGSFYEDADAALATLSQPPTGKSVEPEEPGRAA
jgi:hypothetical protein